ncbi:type II secretion system protein GspL [Caenimonas terrae]|uniref:Type II secretion system protein GspL n=1 Tax=Caenimonas terrae TaxID=696074 RepID=A0ABW0N6E4_9BURK
MSSLIFLLPATSVTATTEFAYLVTPDGRSVAAHAIAPVALLPQPAGAAGEVVAIAPVTALSWHQVELPKGVTAASPRLRAVLEGLLEDRLLDEPEALHFALQPRAVPGQPVWVAVCSRQWLRDAVQVLEAAGRPISRIVPEFTPEEPLALSAIGEPEHATLVLTGSDGVLALPLAAHALALLPPLPDDAQRIAEPAVAALAEQLLQHPVQLQQAPQRWLRAAQSGWDLAQSEFASSNRARAVKRLAALGNDVLRAPQWRPARWGAIVLVAANLAGLNAWAWKERSSLAAKHAAVQRVLTTTFPQVKVVVDAPLQMEKEVALLRQGAGATSSRDMEAMLGELAAVAPPQRPLSAIDYVTGELRVKGLASSPPEAAALAESLRSRGYAAELRGDALVLNVREAP